MGDSMNTKIKDFTINHAVIQCAETPQMAFIARQIADLQAEYDKLREKEQRSQFAAFIKLVRRNTTERIFNSLERSGT